MVLNVRYSAEEEERAIDTLLGHHVEAMIVAGIDQTDRSRLLKQSGIPVVQTMDLTDDPVDINIGLSTTRRAMPPRVLHGLRQPPHRPPDRPARPRAPPPPGVSSR